MLLRIENKNIALQIKDLNELNINDFFKPIREKSRAIS